MAKRQIVDENDKLIGLKSREELDLKSDIYRVSALWLTNSKGEVLIAQRAAKLNKAPRKWSLAVTGTLEENETYDSNIYKEAKEELGLVGVEFTKSKKLRAISHGRQHFCQCYYATVNKAVDEFVLDTNEVAQIDWVSEDMLRKDIFLHPKKYMEGTKGLAEIFIKTNPQK